MKDEFTARVQDLRRITIPYETGDVLNINKGDYVHCTIEKYSKPHRKDYTYKEFK